MKGGPEKLLRFVLAEYRDTQALPVKLDPMSRYCQFRIISPSRFPTSTRIIFISASQFSDFQIFASPILLDGLRFPRLTKSKPAEKLEEALEMLRNF